VRSVVVVVVVVVVARVVVVRRAVMMWFDLAAAAVNGTKHSTTHQYDNIHARVTRDAFTVTPVSHGSVSRRTELMHVSHKTPSNSGESRSLSDVVR